MLDVGKSLQSIINAVKDLLTICIINTMRKKQKIIYLIFALLLLGCGDEAMPPFKKLTDQQLNALTPGEKTCYAIANSLNNLFPDNPTHCFLIQEKSTGFHKENYSFFLKTATKKTAEWNKWGCLAAGKVMRSGAEVGMEKIYFKSMPSNNYATAIDAYVCKNLQAQAYNKEISEFDVLKEFNKRSSLKEM